MNDFMILADGLIGADCLIDSTVNVENVRTGMQGLILTKHVYVLPTITKPDVDLMVSFCLKSIILL